MTLTTTSLADVVAALVAEISPDDADLYRPRFNVAPSDLHWIVEKSGGQRLLVPAVWGYLASGRALINVRGETLAAGTGFRAAFRASRCVVVTDGFLEWSAAKTPFWYHRRDGGLVLLAGLYQPGGDAPPPAVPSPRAPTASRPRFTVITTRPNQLVAQVHNRMPVVLQSHQLDEWLTGEPRPLLTDLLAPTGEDQLVATPLSRRVNSVKFDDPACLAPLVTPPDADEARPLPRQTNLF